jgi:hypothetical protein
MSTTIFVGQEQDWKTWALAANGKCGTHSGLADTAAHMGLEVEPDDEDRELPFIARPGNQRYGLHVIGEIRGGHKAVVTITAKIV